MRYRLLRWVAAVTACAALAACDEKEPASPTPPPASKFAPDAGAQAGSGSSGAGAMLGAGGSSSSGPAGAPKKMSLQEALAQAPKLDPLLEPLRKTYEAATEAYKKPPHSAATKHAYVEAAYNYGHAIEYSEKIEDPPVKYRASLLLYRKALAADPTHAASLSEEHQIEAIYKSMGMPAPK